MVKTSAAFWKGINVVVDTTWGDGGKGKLVDVGAQYTDMVIRYSGGGNAGHTVQNPSGDFKLHLIPSGIFSPNVVNVIASGVVVDPILLADEITKLFKQGITISPKNLRLSGNCHMITPWHKMRDGLGEKARGGAKIGTTGKGIGPAYSDRTSREGLRLKDLLSSDFSSRFRRENKWQEKLVQLMDGKRKSSYADSNDWINMFQDAKAILAPYIANTLPIIWKYQDEKKNIVGEGAQGALLDLDLGGYPFVTSSHPGIAGFSISTAIHADRVRNVIGVTKAYSTRVGAGPMPTELHDADGMHLQTKGKEVGTTTGRVRRCGWFDSLAVRYGARISGTRSLCITKLDVLDKLTKVKICVGYIMKGKTYTSLPSADPEFMARVKPIYETLDGWQEDTTSIRSFTKLPKQTKQYIKRIEKLVGLPIDIVSVGPDRDATIYK